MPLTLRIPPRQSLSHGYLFEEDESGGPRGARTHDPRIKSPMLYRLS